MRWDYGWHGQEKREVSVKEAIELRDSGTLKTGDLFCCPCENTRLSPVDSVVRVKHLRQHPKYRKKQEKVPCNKIRKARERGESWKYSRVVDAIMHYLETDGKEPLKIESVELGKSKEDPAIIVTHSEILQGFDSEKSYIIVPFQNLRRSTELFNRHAPNSVAVEIHRWRDGDVDFINYIRERVDKAYEIGKGSSLSPEFLHSKTNIPNMGVWKGKSGGLGRGMTLKVDADVHVDSEEYKVLSEIERMIDVVEEHNLWAISTPGMHRYHLKNLKFKDISTREGHHPDPSIDAMISQFNPARLKELAAKVPENRSDDWYNRAIEGDEGAMQEGIQELTEIRRRVKEEAIQKQIKDGMDSDLARKIAEDSLADLGSPEDELRAQIEFEQSVIKSREEYKKELRDEHQRDFEKSIDDLFKKGKVTFDNEAGTITIISEYGEVILDPKNYFYDVLIVAVPEIHFWDQLVEDEKKKIMTKACRVYRKYTIFRGAPTRLDLLTDLGVGETPKILTDTTGIANVIENLPESDEDEFTPISSEDLNMLKYYLWADRDLSFSSSRHHSFVELIRKVNHSTDEITRKVVLNLPQPIENLLNGEGGVGDQILDFLSNAIADSLEPE